MDKYGGDTDYCELKIWQPGNKSFMQRIVCPYTVHVFVLSLSGPQEVAGLKSPGMGRGQRFVIEGLSEKSSVVTEPWERLLEIVGVVGARCEWQGEKEIGRAHV